MDNSPTEEQLKFIASELNKYFGGENTTLFSYGVLKNSAVYSYVFSVRKTFEGIILPIAFSHIHSMEFGLTGIVCYCYLPFDKISEFINLKGK